ncbi:hypothetical protein [Nonlabens sp. Hel1_33_55]|uniref:hypothetical protein n=1 Tax=Nonlabens sp. Hel1_33_55 TaxID=1336802 RepID=UPI000B82E96D|nr:hypothetical protein [Nonlabens sp. Hel1_33_55]
MGLCLIAAIFFIYALSVGDDPIQMDEDGIQGMTVVPMMYIAYAIMAIILGLVLVFVVINLFTKPGALKSAAVSVGIMLVIILLAYFVFADNSTLDPATGQQVMLDDGEALTAADSQWIGAALWTFYIVGILSILSILWAGASKLIKK